MNVRTLVIIGVSTLTAIVTLAADRATHAAQADAMQLGNFSVSLAVKDIAASRAFYEKLGFEQVGGKLDQHWIVLQNGAARIGLFQGMFDRNTLTFNPGWTKDKEVLKRFQDVRALQRTLMERGIAIPTPVDETSTGPAYFTVTDPDGNPILIDQHVPRPER